MRASLCERHNGDTMEGCLVMTQPFQLTCGINQKVPMETITSLKVDLILPFIQSNFVQLTPVMIIIIGYSIQ